MTRISDLTGPGGPARPDEIAASYRLSWPRCWNAPAILTSPHSGAEYSESLLARSLLPIELLRSSEDAFVDRLVAVAPSLGAPLLCARAPRAWVDLNRGRNELDPALIEGLGRQPLNPRVASGLGVVPRVVAGGRIIMAGKISPAEAEERLATCWSPWHQRLDSLLDAGRRRFGRIVLLDCHSMPHEATAVASHQHRNERRPEIVLGDRFGVSTTPEISTMAEQAFQSVGLRVTRNTPFAGGYITRKHGHPERGLHALQIEIDRALYMDEVKILPRADFGAFAALIATALTRLMGNLRDWQQADRNGDEAEDAFAAE